MSSNRFVKATFNYAELIKRCHPDQMDKLKIFMKKSRTYKERIAELSEIPKIDWEYYKQKVRPEFVHVVEEFEKKYKEFQVPYPEDPYTPQIEELKKQVEEEVACFKEESNGRIQQYEDEFVLRYCQIPFDQMTMEDYCFAYPDIAPDFLNRPTFWPHTPEEQTPGPADPKAVEKMRMEEEKLERDYLKSISEQKQNN